MRAAAGCPRPGLERLVHAWLAASAVPSPATSMDWVRGPEKQEAETPPQGMQLSLSRSLARRHGGVSVLVRGNREAVSGRGQLSFIRHRRKCPAALRGTRGWSGACVVGSAFGLGVKSNRRCARGEWGRGTGELRGSDRM